MLKQLAASALDLVFPPRCASCACMVASPGALCGACFAELSFITAPCCACCGLPFGFHLDEGALCGECIKDMPPFRLARAALQYDDRSRLQVLGLKFHDRTQFVPMMARLMKQAGAECFYGADALVPVPLHFRRLLRRGFNQSALLARALARDTGIRVHYRALVRRKYTPPQAGLTRAQRLDNVRGVFIAHPRAQVRGKVLVLVDDVYTTGATVKACAKALLRAGAIEVRVLTLARKVL